MHETDINLLFFWFHFAAERPDSSIDVYSLAKAILKEAFLLGMFATYRGCANE